MTAKTKDSGTVRRITVNSATFAGETIELAPINFFYGRNGSGKTTVASSFLNASNLEWLKPSSRDECEVQVFDRAFIDRNFLSDVDELRGVFTVGEENIQVVQKLEELNQSLREEAQKHDDAVDGITAKEEEMKKQTSDFRTKVWDKSKDYRDTYPEALVGFRGKKDVFADALLKATPASHDESELRKRYEAAYGSDAGTYPEIKKILLNLPSANIMGKRIESTAKSSFASVVTKLQATDWVRQGHDHFASAAGDQCPYCQQKLPDNFEKRLEEVFDETYEEEIRELNAFADSYKERVAELLRTPDSKSLSDPMPSLDYTAFDDKVERLRGELEKNVTVIDAKLEKPSQKMEIENLTELQNQINSEIDKLNSLILENNTLVSAGKVMRESISKDVWGLIAETCKDQVREFNKNTADLSHEISKFTEEKKAAETEIVRIRGELATLQGQTRNTAKAIEAINRILKDADFQGFEIRQVQGNDTSYEVVRNDGTSVEKTLSEGEVNFISFLYFFQTVLGTLDKDGATKQKIVVIDDPVTSMDASSLFIVAALIRRLAKMCKDNWLIATKGGKKSLIEQVVVLTHNDYFFKEVTQGSISDFQFVSTFKVSKTQNQSHVDICTRPRANAPSQVENYSPVVNQYQALWREYQTLEEPTTLLNVMRRILEQYFIITVGFNSESMRQTVLVDNKTELQGAKQSGDKSDYQAARSMLSYLSSPEIGVNDDIFIPESSFDPDRLRRVFEQIFTLLGQAQHYKMMTNQASLEDVVEKG